MPALQPFPYDTKSQSRAVHRTGFARSVGGRTLRCLGVSTPRLTWGDHRPPINRRMSTSPHGTTRVGVVLPSRETVIAGHKDARLLLDTAVAAERLGFDSVWTGDSLFHRPRFDPLSALAAVAARTERVSVGTAILLPALRHPLIVAQALASIDLIARGRLIVGVGAGWIPLEFEAVGVPFAQRMGRTVETVELCRKAWRGEELDARYWDLPSVDVLPKPAQPGGPPVWMGGSGPLALKHAGTRFDGWIPTPPSPESFAAGWARVRTHAEAAGRDPASIVPAAYVTVNLRDDERETRSYAEQYYGMPLEVMREVQSYFVGDPSSCANWLQGFIDAGARHIALRFATLSPIEQMEHAAEVIIPAIRTRN